MKAAAAAPRPDDLRAPGSLAGTPAPGSIFEATRITIDSPHDFVTTRAAFDTLVPAFDPLLARDLVLRNAAWAEVEDSIAGVAGPEGFIALSRLDHGALMSLHGQPAQATQYLVGNPVIARRLVSADTAAALYAPFTVAIHADKLGTHISYTTPSSLLGSLGSTDINEVAADLDRRIDITVQKTCHPAFRTGSPAGRGGQRREAAAARAGTNRAASPTVPIPSGRLQGLKPVSCSSALTRCGMSPRRSCVRNGRIVTPRPGADRAAPRDEPDGRGPVSFGRPGRFAGLGVRCRVPRSLSWRSR